MDITKTHTTTVVAEAAMQDCNAGHDEQTKRASSDAFNNVLEGVAAREQWEGPGDKASPNSIHTILFNRLRRQHSGALLTFNEYHHAK